MNTPANVTRYLEVGAAAVFIVVLATILAANLNTSPNTSGSFEDTRDSRAISSLTIYKPNGSRHLTASEVQSLTDYLEHQFRYGAENGELSTAVETSIWYELQTRGLNHMFLNYGQCQTSVCRVELIHESRSDVETVLGQLERTVITAGDSLLQARTDVNGRHRVLIYFPAPGTSKLVLAEREKTP